MVLAQAWQAWKSARTVFALAVIALAVGIASTTAIFTVVNAVMLTSLAYEHGERYGQLFSAMIGKPDGRGSLALADLLVYQQAQSCCDLFGWFKPQTFNLADADVPLPQLASRMNAFLHRCTQANKYATFFYAQLDERCGRLRYVNAGHNPPYLVRAAGGLQELSTGGSVIGLLPDLQYEEGSVDLQSGDLLVMFTDGVTEALNADGEEFGEARMQALVREVAPLPVQQISSRLVAELQTWMKGAAQYDDLTFVLVKMNA